MSGSPQRSDVEDLPSSDPSATELGEFQGALSAAWAAAGGMGASQSWSHVLFYLFLLLGRGSGGVGGGGGRGGSGGGGGDGGGGVLVEPSSSE